MKKYNLSKIMKRAWELVKTAGETISAALKKSWKEAKSMTLSLRDRVINELNNLIENAADCYEYEIRESKWEKGGKSRTYFKVIETRKNSKHYVARDFGYIDNIANEYKPSKWDVFGAFDLSGARR